MRLANRIPQQTVANDIDPRDTSEADVIDLAQRNAFPAVARPGGKSDAMGMVAGIAIVAGLGAITLWSMNTSRLPEQPSVGSEQVVPASPATTAQVTAPVVVPPPAQPSSNAGIYPTPEPVIASAPQTQAMVNPYNSPTVVFDAGSVAGMAAAAAVAEASEPGAAVAEAGSAGEFASRVGGVGGAPAQARAMTNPATTVTQGTLIPAILETAIDTNVPGYVRAVVSQDVRSFDGTKVLVPRSSRLIGQYQSGMQNGQKRAYVIWTRLIRPDGASVNLASPAVGFDGTTGLAGDVSGNGFFKRFGSAMLLSVVGGLGTLATGGAGGIVLGGASQSAAATAAEQDGKRGPTVRVRQGEPIRIFTARDLDFSRVS